MTYQLFRAAVVGAAMLPLALTVTSLLISPTVLQLRAAHCIHYHAAAAAAATSRHRHCCCTADEAQVVSPFDATEADATEAELTSKTGPLKLTEDNVELVLDDMRPYLLADGGNVALRSIEGGIVQLELQGACGSCPSSAMTMKMGLERGLLERIPEIVSVEQVIPDGPVLDEEAIDAVLEEIRPFLKMTGGTVDLIDLQPEGLQPTARLAITGSGATINSVRVEIAQRLKRNFPTLANVEWD